MEKTNQKNNKNEFEKDLDDLREWGVNQYNPGHYIGNGRTPRPTQNIVKNPWILIVLGIMTLLPMVFQLISIFVNSDNFVGSITSIVLGLALSGAFIYGGIARIRSNKKKG